MRGILNPQPWCPMKTYERMRERVCKVAHKWHYIDSSLGRGYGRSRIHLAAFLRVGLSCALITPPTFSIPPLALGLIHMQVLEEGKPGFGLRAWPLPGSPHLATCVSLLRDRRWLFHCR
ncbi:hypothetical protein DPEC_G00019040 [Dallia pectoralis]|uniref:Uncharacterized protein n=1 Tax=Dallia pectoralis TaxID=75939 RepID=A0ACC2HG78_DALPE|nr:hypothetical protein DPEC_G00019040 [Dallia pectoralis]